MIAFPILAGLSSEPFSGEEAVNGVVADLTREITYVAGVTSDAKQAEIAREFLAFLQSPAAKAIIRARGLTPSCFLAGPLS